jgi:hypothetical protein
MYEVKGAEQLAILARRLKAAGEKDLAKRLNKSVNDAMKPLRQTLPQSARAKLPRRGGLAELVARSKIRTVRRNTGRAVGVRLRAENPDNIRRIDKGQVRHPVYGHRVWVTQRVPAGWFTEPTEAAAPNARKQISAAVDAIAAEIDGKQTPP